LLKNIKRIKIIFQRIFLPGVFLMFRQLVFTGLILGLTFYLTNLNFPATKLMIAKAEEPVIDAPTFAIPDERGGVVLYEKVNQAVLTDATQAVMIELYNSVTDPGIDVSALINSESKSGTLPEITISLDVASVFIPSGTVVTGPAGWDGIINLPTLGEPDGGKNPAGLVVGETVITLGSLTGALNFSKPVVITLTGVTGSFGYRPTGLDQWVEIPNICTGTYENPTSVPAGGACAISNDADTKILTYHLTSFGNLIDEQLPEVFSAETQDLNGNGRLDAIKLTFSERIDDARLAKGTPDNWDVIGYEGESISTGSTENDKILLLSFSEGLVTDLDALPTVTYKQAPPPTNGCSTHDLAGNELKTGSWESTAKILIPDPPTDSRENIADPVNSSNEAIEVVIDKNKSKAKHKATHKKPKIKSAQTIQPVRALAKKNIAPEKIAASTLATPAFVVAEQPALNSGAVLGEATAQGDKKQVVFWFLSWRWSLIGLLILLAILIGLESLFWRKQRQKNKVT
jgi:hypothetical protein